ncbi:MAG TPA: ATP synthase F1 subunit gamma [Candidatus Paceibacterota bacterium]|nr:ATP synthase F1 subunit gamma [Candidatus Paceibacterota bacterium]
MAGLKAIKLKIRSIDKTRKVTQAMEAVSAAKMRKSQAAALSGRAYARAAMSTLSRVSGTADMASHPLAKNRDVKKAMYIVITSDKGLAGGLNSGVLRAAYADVTSLGLQPKDVSIIAVGRKAFEFFTRRGYEVEAFHFNTADTVSEGLMSEIMHESADRFAKGNTDLVRIAYQNFISTFEQRPTIRTIFPLSLTELAKVVADITPAKGKFAEKTAEAPSAYTIEPSPEEVLSAILPKLASIFVYHALLESHASEHSARMVAMKAASDKGEEMEHELTLEFNKARQAAITREVSEITGGMEAMTGK